MPHATNDENMEMTGEHEAAEAYLRDNDFESLGQFVHDREFDQKDKDADAIDYEDISDDDLPEEEEADNKLEDEADAEDLLTQAAGDVAALPDLSQTNGHHDEPDPNDDDIFGLGEHNDLFGESISSPEEERRPKLLLPGAPKTGGLVLPGKFGLALPSLAPTAPKPRPLDTQRLQYSPTSQSPPEFRDDSFARSSPSSAVDSDEDNESDEDELVKAQRQLLRAAARRQGTGKDTNEDDVELDLSTFYTFFPSYEKDQNPRFVEFFPPRPVTYRGKLPIKPPKPVQPTKISLDLLPDQERSFKTAASANVNSADGLSKTGIIHVTLGQATNQESDDDLALSDFDENEVIGKVSMQDLALVCQDWEIASLGAGSEIDMIDNHYEMDGDWENHERARPKKRQKTSVFDSIQSSYLSFEHPEEAAAKIAETVTLDLNDPNLLIDEHAPPTKKIKKRVPGDLGRDPALSKDLAKRYNVSNDEAYDLLKENHQNKIRSTLGSMAVEHSLPARKLQYPFYKVALDIKTKRNFHRPSLVLIDRGREYKFQKPKLVKKKERRGKEIKDLFSTAESLALNDNANVLMLEYSEEAPIMLSNFGMGNRLINYYRKRNPDDQDRPKLEIGETQVLLTQDKSPFANFGHVDQGEIVPTIQNGMYRAPVFQHKAKSNDFMVAINTTHRNGSKMYIRNVENLHIVGQQFPLVEVPGEHSRRVTDAAKKRLQALSYRIYTKSMQPGRKDKQLDNASIMVHLKGHDMPQTRSKMREFMKYEKAGRDGVGVWVPPQGKSVPDADTMRDWIKPEDIALLDSMQVGVQHLHDLGISTGKDADDDKEDETGSIEAQLAPWRITKNFINATQGKAMLKLHGDGEPTGRGEGFSFVRTSMKGGFQALGESVEDRLDARKRRDNGGHSYNVAKQQKAYDDYIRMIWDKQKQSLKNDAEMSDVDMDDEPEAEPESAYPYSRAATPRSTIGGTPSAYARRDDESASQFSKGSAGHRGKVTVIKRISVDGQGNTVVVKHRVTNPKVAKMYKDRRVENQLKKLSENLMDFEPTGDVVTDELKKQKLMAELKRIERNRDRRFARENAKRRVAGSPMADSPAAGQSDIDGPPSAIEGSTPVNPAKPGRGRNKDGTARKCANCGQVGHIKTNRKLCPMLNGTMKPEEANANGDNTFGAVAPKLVL
ncbi:putative transcription initiation factor tfiid 111 kda [Acrodontium crateriforme]|uniref:Transcription initiation factor tfiid 111 kDa n=1 Tax=Acrodontium crateriforme TaxID=150365 RepID=A0AAQ3M560_9PEZI|nr:putative transcription initiation factor tfiid 111 kda [Acrodontium crateriforme]